MQITPNDHEKWVDDVLHDFFPEKELNQQEISPIIEQKQPNNPEKTLA